MPEQQPSTVTELEEMHVGQHVLDGRAGVEWVKGKHGWDEADRRDHPAPITSHALVEHYGPIRRRNPVQQQPDTVIELRKVLMSAGYFVEPYVAHDLARAVLARTDLVVPRADAVPRQALLDLADEYDRLRMSNPQVTARELRALAGGAS